jgi:ribosomal protein S18 acetylase RimI-like enzyme
MTRADVPAGLALCRTSGWNQTTTDWEELLELGGERCRVAVIDGRVVGTAATVIYENHFAWIGMVLVAPEVRGRGIGRALLRDALDSLGDVPARLDATREGHPLYLKLGFVEECRLQRMRSTSASPDGTYEARGARPMRREDLDAVSSWDRRVFGADRRNILEWALEKAPGLAFVVERGAAIRGYCLGRRGHIFQQIGPVVAEDREAASQLVEMCRQRATNEPMVADAPTAQRAWTGRLMELGFVTERPFIRMCRGTNRHPGQPDQQMAIFGPEWG